MKRKTALVIHGGAGVIGALLPERERQYHEALLEIVTVGAEKIKAGESAVKVVIECVRLLEDHPLFNAGRGSVLNSVGAVEMDACVMNGSDLSTGAVGAVTGVRNPILAADAVRVAGEHVLLCGAGAEAFCRNKRIPFESKDYFILPERQAQLDRAKKSNRMLMDHDGHTTHGKIGTVGAVCCDSQGNLAAATSTGGIVNKLPGRIGDSPLPGAGTYADNRGCAVSATGEGEALIRILAAGRVSLKVQSGIGLKEAATETIFDELDSISGKGGLIAVNAKGEIATPFNTGGMFRAIFIDGKIQTAIH